MPRRVQLYRRRGWRKPPGCVVVARPTRWGNPFVVGKDGDAAECVRLFAGDIHHPNSRLGFTPADLEQLRGKDLACWCRLDAACHADVLLELANTSSDEGLTAQASPPFYTSSAAHPAAPEPESEPETRVPNMTVPIHCLHTEVRALADLREHPKNPNRHPEGQVALLAKILLTRGWRHPIVVSRQSGLIVKGHGRLAAAKHAGLTYAPVELQDYANANEEIADLVADNRIAEFAETDSHALAGLIEELRLDPDFDVMLTGFGATEADELLNSVIAASDVHDGIEGSAAPATITKLADTTFKFGTVRFSVPREDYKRWEENIRRAVGFNKRAIGQEILRRLGIA